MATALVIPKFSAVKLRATLDRLDVSIAELGRRLSNTDVGRQSVSKWVNGHRTPNLENVYKLANALGVDISEITEVAE